MKCLSVFLLVAMALQTMKVFNKKEQSNWWSLPLPSRGRWAMGSRHLPLGVLHFTGAMKRQRQLSTGQSNYTNSWLAALLSLALSPSPSLCLQASICPLLCASFTHTHNPPPHTQSFHVIQGHHGSKDCVSVPLTPSPATNIYCAALIYSGLISES